MSHKLTVLMSVYNAEDFLADSIESVLAEKEDFEFLIINDGSTDDTAKILERYAKKDKRIRILTQSNKGLVAALNRGINEARGKFIARMDADDYTMPLRFKRQLKVLDNNPGVVLVAGGFRVIDTNNNIVDHIYPYLRFEELKRRLFIGNAIAHGSTMYRKQAVIDAGMYSYGVGPTEDYELWTRLMKVGKIVSIPQLIYTHRMNPEGVSATRNKLQQKEMAKNINTLWSSASPSVISFLTMRRALKFYEKQPYGRDQWLWNYLRDNAKLGMKMIRYRHMLKGVLQLLNVILADLSGTRIVFEKFKNINKSAARELRANKT